MFRGVQTAFKLKSKYTNWMVIMLNLGDQLHPGNICFVQGLRFVQNGSDSLPPSYRHINPLCSR